jgi:hypothetical protein
MHTPLVYLCQGCPLGTEHAFFATNRAVNSAVAESHRNNRAIARLEEEEEEDDDDDDDDDEKWYDVEESLPYVPSS